MRLTYPEAIEKIAKDGHLFDLDQISISVISQLFMARDKGIIKISYDSYPIRGQGRGSGEWVRVFELIK
jgi:hypothetical protein